MTANTQAAATVEYVCTRCGNVLTYQCTVKRPPRQGQAYCLVCRMPTPHARKQGVER